MVWAFQQSSEHVQRVVVQWLEYTVKMASSLQWSSAQYDQLCKILLSERSRELSLPQMHYWNRCRAQLMFLQDIRESSLQECSSYSLPKQWAQQEILLAEADKVWQKTLRALYNFDAECTALEPTLKAFHDFFLRGVVMISLLRQLGVYFIALFKKSSKPIM